jgi:HD-GYP domain-containing protein (c-di-GMP phosphodiesterase class II)
MQMRLSEAEIEEVRVAGIVHDIGKTHVPDPVRLKVKLLTAEEFQIMKNHADWGARILEPLGEEGIARIVRHHHERYDGTGYPDHLKGEDIPLGARIVGLAECFDAMISDLDYKAPRTFDDAVAEVRRCSGTQFDPKVVRAFLNQV